MGFTREALKIVSWKAYAQQPAWDLAVRKAILEPGRAAVGHDPICFSCGQKGICCRQLVPIMLYDAMPLAHYLLTAGLLNTRSVQTFRALGDRQLASTASKWIHENEPCCLQDENGRCIAYPARPMVCRCAWAWTGPENCVDVGVDLDSPKLPGDRPSAGVAGASIDLQRMWSLGPSAFPFTAPIPHALATCIEALTAKSDRAAHEALVRGPWMSMSDVDRIVDVVLRQTEPS